MTERFSRRRDQEVTGARSRVQDIPLSLHTVRATYAPARVFPWAAAIAHNRRVDGARRYARRATNEVLVEEYAAAFSHEDANKNEDAYGTPVALRGRAK